MLLMITKTFLTKLIASLGVTIRLNKISFKDNSNFMMKDLMQLKSKKRLKTYLKILKPI